MTAVTASPFNAALSGLAQSSKKLAASADAIARSGQTNAEDVATSATATENTDLVTNLINTKIAAYDYKANLKTLKVADDLQKVYWIY